ncbi:ribulose-phosphate 3-epimerase [Alkalibaculum sp. M08DMB]|uniref:Ribulose-phosphate 3-epimerase n=1 Tax=Alkalibaculum sporogenes TaxID=2655001 RepID=A0A6A7K7G6_9FIRM|nr:ribulose-phosphate 3-epimerase [Alkalibaculum sporogenes]MPW25336.1 ribulose-phosphate 3-epimerase [Alkalibaculum sporogenes]
MIKVSASIMCGNPMKFGEELRRLEDANVEMIHFDMMDGSFVPNIAMGLYLLEDMKKNTKIPFDVHLAAWEPSQYYERIAAAGVEYLSIHTEAVKHIHRDIQKINELGISAGVVLNPATTVNALQYIIEDIKMVTIMTVDPGFAGQKFIKSQLKKIREVKEMAQKYNKDLLISVDGNINKDTIPDCVKNGANVLVAGTSSIFKGDNANYKELVKEMKNSINGGK